MPTYNTSVATGPLPKLELTTDPCTVKVEVLDKAIDLWEPLTVNSSSQAGQTNEGGQKDIDARLLIVIVHEGNNMTYSLLKIYTFVPHPLNKS